MNEKRLLRIKTASSQISQKAFKHVRCDISLHSSFLPIPVGCRWKLIGTAQDISRYKELEMSFLEISWRAI